MQIPNPIRAILSRLTADPGESAEQRLLARLSDLATDLTWELNPRGQQLAAAVDTYKMETGR